MLCKHLRGSSSCREHGLPLSDHYCQNSFPSRAETSYCAASMSFKQRKKSGGSVKQRLYVCGGLFCLQWSLWLSSSDFCPCPYSSYTFGKSPRATCTTTNNCRPQTDCQALLTDVDRDSGCDCVDESVKAVIRRDEVASLEPLVRPFLMGSRHSNSLLKRPKVFCPFLWLLYGRNAHLPLVFEVDHKQGKLVLRGRTSLQPGFLGRVYVFEKDLTFGVGVDLKSCWPTKLSLEKIRGDRVAVDGRKSDCRSRENLSCCRCRWMGQTAKRCG